MKQTTTWMVLGGLVLPLGLWSAAAGQQDDTPEAEPPAPELADPEVFEVDGPVQPLVLVQPAQGLDERQVEEEMLRLILKDLMEQGFSEDDAREMLGLDPGALPEEESVEASGAVVASLPDGEALYLPLGTTRTLAVEAGATLEVPFVADGPGILTVAYSNTGGGRVNVVVMDPSGRRVQGGSSRTASGRTSDIVRHELLPLGAAGEYTVRLTVGNTGDLKLGAEWIPFPQVESVRAEVVPEPDPDTALVLVPGRMAEGSIDTADEAATHLWCRFDAEADGQLIVLANASRGDITMQSYMDGRFNNAMEYVDSDLNGSVANEGIVIDAVAGQTYYVRIDMRSGARCDVEVRTGWVELPEAE